MFKTIRFRLLLIAVVPLLFALVLTGKLVTTSYNDLAELNSIDHLVKLANYISAYVHETQKERGATGVYLGSGGEKFGPELDAQRLVTDEKKTELNGYLQAFEVKTFGPDLAHTLALAVDKKDALDAMRAKVSKLDVLGIEAIGYYTTHNGMMLDVIAQISKRCSNVELAKATSLYSNFLYGKERTGIERAVMCKTFAMDRFEVGTLQKFGALVTEQKVFFNQFKHYASDKQNALYEEKLSGKTNDEVLRMRKIAFAKGTKSAKAGLSGKLSAAFGYGGAIHNFKNYVLRNNPKYAEQFMKNYERANALLDTLSEAAECDEELQWYVTIRATLQDYHAGLEKVMAAYKEGEVTAKQVDGLVKVSDKDALAALTSLADSVKEGQFGVDPGYWFDTMTKYINGMKEVENALASALGKQVTRLLSSARFALTVLVSCVIVVSLGVLLLIYIVSRGIIKPLQQSVNFAESVAKGDLTKQVEVKREDEIGTLIKALNKMSSSLRKTVMDVSGNAKQLACASNDLSSTATQLSSGAEEATGQSAMVAAAAEEMSVNMNNMSSSSVQVNTEVMTVSTAVEEMAASIGEVARNAEEASSVASEAAMLATESNESIGKLGTAAEEIGKVVEVIQDIAEQTNLLALNATIEAARAGDAGKGFAVVASEVKELANQTAEATENISSRIAAIQTSTNESVKSIGKISGIINNVNEVSQTIASAVEEQSITTKEIAQNVVKVAHASDMVSRGVAETATASAEITKNITNVDSAAKQTAQGADQTQAAGTTLLSLSQEIEALVAQFKV